MLRAFLLFFTSQSRQKPRISAADLRRLLIISCKNSKNSGDPSPQPPISPTL
jgi:hypothetical protein